MDINDQFYNKDGSLKADILEQPRRAVPRIEINDSKLNDKIEGKTVRDVLNERGKRYGAFVNHARCSRALHKAFYDTYANSDGAMTDVMEEALAIIFNKLARIANGDPAYKDSWVDIAGYSTLVADTLKD